MNTVHTRSQIAPVTSPQFTAAYKVLRDAIDAKAFPGCAFGVLAGDQVVLQDALGRFTYEDNALEVTPATIYDVASLTKVVSTTATAMLLHQQQRLHLDAPLGDYLPGFVVGRSLDEKARHVTLRHLLAHSSGLPGYVDLYRTAHSPAGLFRNLLELPLESEPGTHTEYSDMGFILLGKALEVTLRGYLASWSTHNIFELLAMQDSGFCPPAALRHTIPPTEIDEEFRKRTIQGEVQDEHAWLLNGAAGHAGLFSNVPDLLRFSDEILKSAKNESGENTTFFNAHTIALFSERQSPPGSSRALGWDTPSPESSAGKYFSQKSIGHLGFSGCSLWIDLSAGIAVVLLTNRTWPDRKNQLIREVRPAFHDAVREAIC
ncbi:MAG TPA: serine hydrolase domain-containing protein [Terracidiphilus sp.]|nr:serine hydrolase domain-containing protein [Terracidiphilus sp.]